MDPGVKEGGAGATGRGDLQPLRHREQSHRTR